MDRNQHHPELDPEPEEPVEAPPTDFELAVADLLGSVGLLTTQELQEARRELLAYASERLQRDRFAVADLPMLEAALTEIERELFRRSDIA